MILYIKGADFSASNIGTLSTYVVRKSLGLGITHDIPNFVDKDAQDITWTVTLKTNYVFTAYSILMGEEVITPTITDNVMTISIPVVTNNITITIATEYEENTGDDSGDDVVAGVLLNNSVDFGTISVAYGPTQGKGGSSFVERTNLQAGQFIEHIDFWAIAPDKTFPANSVTIPVIKLYFVDAETDLVEELVYDQIDQVTILSDKEETNGYQILRCPINRTLTKATHIGITINEGYEDFRTLYTIPYVTYANGGSKLPQPYFGSVINIGFNIKSKTAAYYCPMVIYGY